MCENKRESRVLVNLLKLVSVVAVGISLILSLMLDLNRPERLPGGESTLLKTIRMVVPQEEVVQHEEKFSVSPVQVHGGKLMETVRELHEAGIIPARLPSIFGNKRIADIPSVATFAGLHNLMQACAEVGYTSVMFEVSPKSLFAQAQKRDANAVADALFMTICTSYLISDISKSLYFEGGTADCTRYQISWINTDFAHMSEAVESMLRVVNRGVAQNSEWEPLWLRLNAEEIFALGKALNILRNAGIHRNDDDLLRARKLHDALIPLVTYHEVNNPRSVFYRNRNKFVIYAMDGNAICEGYAQAYGFLLRLAGVQSQLICGLVHDEQGKLLNAHAWNLVKVGEKDWRHVDVTWDDHGDRAVADFFMRTDSEMKSRAAGFRAWEDKTFMHLTNK